MHFNILWLWYFHGYFYDMMVTYIFAQLYVVKQIQVLRFLKMMSVKFLSMNVILLGFGKVRFCEKFAKRGTLQNSGREVLREETFEK